MNFTQFHIDDLILKSFAEGDASSFTRIYHQLYPYVFFVARRMVQGAASDVLADVFAKVWAQKKQFDTSKHLFYYVQSMTRNACLDYLKERDRNNKSIANLVRLSNSEHHDIYFREMAEGHLFSMIRQEIDKLPLHMRDVFTLSYIDGLKNREIAALLGIKNSSVRVRKAEALKILKTVFSKSDLFSWLVLIIIKNNL